MLFQPGTRRQLVALNDSAPASRSRQTSDQSQLFYLFKLELRVLAGRLLRRLRAACGVLLRQPIAKPFV